MPRLYFSLLAALVVVIGTPTLDSAARAEPRKGKAASPDP